jgi:hypothetical protein
MTGNQSYVEIYDDRLQLLQENKIPAALIVEQLAAPGYLPRRKRRHHQQSSLDYPRIEELLGLSD